MSSCLLSGALAALGASRAFAADPPCSPIAVAVDAGVHARWPDLLGQVRRAFEMRTDIDACARVELTLNEGSIAIGVTLPDGRSASRQVSRRDDVLPTLEALLLVPRSAPEVLVVATSAPDIAAPAPTQAVEATTVPVVVPVPSPVPERDEMEARQAYPPSHLRVELSVVTDVRFGDGQRSVGLGALSLLDVSGWLVGFEGRADRDQEMAGAYAGPALELTALGGRRFRLHNIAVDLVGGPAVALRGGGADTKVTPGGTTSSRSSPGTVPRALLGAHLIFGARSSFRIFTGVDGEFGPANGPGGNPGDPSRLPVWTLGLALGATVGTR